MQAELIGATVAINYQCHSVDRRIVSDPSQAIVKRVASIPMQPATSGLIRACYQAHRYRRELRSPDITTKKGLRDRAMLAVLLGCGLRRSEVAALTMKHIQQRDNRWCIVDLVGKHGRVRTIQVPTWVKVAVDAWTVQQLPHHMGRNLKTLRRFRPSSGFMRCTTVTSPSYRILRFTSSKKFRSTVTWTEPFPLPASSGA
jgi:integrase